MYSLEKLEILVDLGKENLGYSFEYEDKSFEVNEEEYFFYDVGVYQGSIYSIKDISNKKASVFFVIDQSKGNENYILLITRSYKEALKEYIKFEDIIKSDWATEEQLKRRQEWFSNLEKYEIYNTVYVSKYVSYDESNKEYIFITLDHLDGTYHYGIFGDLIQEESEIIEMDGSMSKYKHGFKSLNSLINYLESVESLKYIKDTLINWPGTEISNLKLLEKAS